jgi:hypothetical protein
VCRQRVRITHSAAPLAQDASALSCEPGDLLRNGLFMIAAPIAKSDPIGPTCCEVLVEINYIVDAPEEFSNPTHPPNVPA